MLLNNNFKFFIKKENNLKTVKILTPNRRKSLYNRHRIKPNNLDDIHKIQTFLQRIFG